MTQEPLGLPKGSIRAILIILLTIFIFAGLFVGYAIPEVVFDFWIAIVALYFGIRAEFTKTKPNE